jgi:SAM-dependent methyltransferase
MKNKRINQTNEDARMAWEENADYWNDYIGEGNDFVEVLCWPAIRRLLGVKPGSRILDIACGNGLTSRRLADLGYQVTAFDFSTQMIKNAVNRSKDYDERIRYYVLDATDENSLLSLGERQFDGAICNMALFDMAQIEPLFNALSQLLVEDSCFVFSLMHPCFNNPYAKLAGEMDDRTGKVVTEYSVRVTRYLSHGTEFGVALRDQPKPQLYFHRPLQMQFAAGFNAGFVIDGLEERAFPVDHPKGRTPLSWGSNFSEIPPVMVVRMLLLPR